MMITEKNTQVLKGSAIILVVAEHIMGNYFQISQYVRNCMGTGGVCIFLFLSGYGVYMSYRKNGLSGKYWDNKINKIFIPYWITTFLYGLYIKSNSTLLLKNLLCIDYDRNYDGTMWYMSLLVIEYIAFFAIFYFVSFDIVKVCFLFILGLVIKENANLFRACGWQFSVNYLSFPCGVLLGYISAFILQAKNVQDFLDKKFIRFMGKILFVMLLGGLYIYGVSAGWGFQIQGILLCMTLLFVVILLPERIKEPLKFVGIISYPIYLVEGKIFEITWDIVAGHTMNQVQILIIYMILLIISTALLWLLCEFIKKKYKVRQTI